MKFNFETLERRNGDSAKWNAVKSKTDREDYLAFSVADSDYAVAPAIQSALENRVSHGAFGYAAASENYYHAIMRWFETRYALPIRKHWIVPAPKVLNALAVIIKQYSKPGEKVCIQTPVYHVFKPMIETNGREVVENELLYSKDGYAIDFEALEKAFASGVKVFILTSPHNPVGRVWTHDELSKMVRLAKKYDVFVASDEIHADVIMQGNTFVSIGQFFDDYDKMAIIGAASKTFNIAGLQSAHIVIADNDVRKTIKHAYRELHIGTPNLLALKAVEAAYGESGEWVDAQNRHVEANYEALKSFWEKHDAKAHVLPLEGTYLAWVHIGFTGMDSETFHKALLEKEAVMVADGKKFGGDGASFIRINLACSRAQLDEGLSRIGNFLRSIQ